jgi:hypothetical protein
LPPRILPARIRSSRPRYAAPGSDGGRFVQQTSGPQIDLLADLFGPGQSPVRGGYLRDHGGMGASALAAVLDARFDRIRVGVHDEAPVILGHAWDGAVEGPDRRITQVFTSTVAGGGYGGQRALGEEFRPACCRTLRAAYLGTLATARLLRPPRESRMTRTWRLLTVMARWRFMRSSFFFSCGRKGRTLTLSMDVSTWVGVGTSPRGDFLCSGDAADTSSCQEAASGAKLANRKRR